MRPGISQADLARQVGVSSAYINTLVKGLEARRRVKRADGGLLAQA
jgi:predicted transcriptional regulator